MDMVDIPLGRFGNALKAYRTVTMLFVLEASHLFAVNGLLHSGFPAILEIQFPFRVKGIGFRHYFYMSVDSGFGGEFQLPLCFFTFIGVRRCEHPFPVSPLF